MNQEYSDKLYAEYSAQRDAMHGASLEAAGRYDRAVLTITTGALAVSLAFLDKVVQHPASSTIPILIGAWIFLIAALIAQLLALSSSQKACQRQIEILDAEYKRYLYTDDPAEAVRTDRSQDSNPFSKRTRRCSVIALCGLIGGIILLMLFSAANMTRKEPDMADKGSDKTTMVNTGDKNVRGSYTPEKNKLPPPPPPKKAK